MKPSEWIALCAVIVSGIAIVATAVSARQNAAMQERISTTAINAQKEQAASERIWQRRADVYVYVELLTWCHESMSIMIRPIPANITRRDALDRLRLPDDLHARARAFASAGVYEKLNTITTFLARWLLYEPEDKAEDPTTDLMQELRQNVELHRTVRDLAAMLREDLGSNRPGVTPSVLKKPGASPSPPLGSDPDAPR